MKYFKSQQRTKKTMKLLVNLLPKGVPCCARIWFGICCIPGDKRRVSAAADAAKRRHSSSQAKCFEKHTHDYNNNPISWYDGEGRC